MAAAVLDHCLRGKRCCVSAHTEIVGQTASRRDLEGNFIDVLRGNGQLACNAALGCATMVTIKMAVESYRQSKTLLWDPKAEKVRTA